MSLQNDPYALTIMQACFVMSKHINRLSTTDKHFERDNLVFDACKQGTPVCVTSID